MLTGSRAKHASSGREGGLKIIEGRHTLTYTRSIVNAMFHDRATHIMYKVIWYDLYKEHRQCDAS